MTPSVRYFGMNTLYVTPSAPGSPNDYAHTVGRVGNQYWRRDLGSDFEQ